MSDHVLVLNTPMTWNPKTGDAKSHTEACSCTYCTSLSGNVDDDDDAFDEELAEAIENQDVDRIRELVADLDDEDREELIENLFEDESEDSDDMTSNEDYDPYDILPEPSMNFGDEQTGKAKVSAPGGWNSPNSELFGRGMASSDKPSLTPISPHSERRGRQINYDTFGQPLPTPAMNFDDSPVAAYYRKLRNG